MYADEIKQWNDQLLEDAAGVFGYERRRSGRPLLHQTEGAMEYWSLRTSVPWVFRPSGDATFIAWPAHDV